MKNKVAIFMGKFQPPHLGHIRTILRIYRDYSKLIIGVTEDKRVMSAYDVKNILDEIFIDYDSIEVEIIKGIVEEGTAEIPNDIDIILSGNQKVLDKLSNRYKTKFIPRTEGIGYSGTELRKSSFANKALSLQNLNNNLKMKLIEIKHLKPLERVLPSHLKNIQMMIERDGIIKKPLIVDREYGFVLDGSHRYAYLLQQGYRFAPVILVDYDDESIFVGNHLRHRFLKDESFIISKAEVRDRAINENIYPPRTTRHFFPFRKEDFPVELEKLEKGNPHNIDYLIDKLSLNEEIVIDKNYIHEIDEEIEIIEKYLQEQKETKKYLLSQIEMMQNEAR